MLLAALALVALAAACTVALLGPLAAPTVVFTPTDEESAATAEAWRSAALDAHARASRLRSGVALSLQVQDPRIREDLLRRALAETARAETVRIDL
jgi:hypothetical protein